MPAGGASNITPMLLDRAGRLGFCALPAALALYFSFNAGGFFPYDDGTKSSQQVMVFDLVATY